MASHQDHHLHFVFFPLMASGHMIPLIDIARLFAQQGIIVTIFTTPHNAARFQTVLTRDLESGLQIRVIQVKFPAEEAGLPEGCENFDMLPSPDLVFNCFAATALLHKPVEKLFEELTPKPNCIISDMSFHGLMTLLASITFQGYLLEEQTASVSCAFTI
ncbi:hypothetical protein Prudu_019754 [Prunus dulcis]|uniref:UDP-Glycosyltransferase superfamily protein n=1 Tax=Prunus dulcis TaxID=3755 RepID=A0A4Y1RUX5_PRUDU|nr:hypothetical protein Prudu_019754 [Prunus dulcis]